MSTTLIDLLRHGEPKGGARYRGRTDDPLTDAGWAQMAQATAQPREWDRVVTSPLKRCARFARPLAARLGVPLQQDAAFGEIDFGRWEGLSAEALMAQDADALARYYADPWANTPPGAEPLAEFQARVVAAWQSLLAAHAGERVLLVSHGGVMRIILSHVLGMSPESLFKLHIPYACVSRVRVDGVGESALTSLLSHNESPAS
ncbi:MAG TPA: histidine phosphatase family protein [Candidatus Tenderia sp.]|nr:histidine phosphatase family protein [Candidatus Tenderia sp.]